ncbi:MAG: site-specific integrase [Muribaculaceae bacterium]|nr:site-specific integrase [Muribaculaceae bacterium]
MEIPIKTSKAKEPIKLRFKSLANGNLSLYLDYYHDGKREYEFLKLYLIPEVTTEDKVANANTLNAANAIKARRLANIADNKAGINISADGLQLSDWIDSIVSRKRNKVSESSIKGLRRLKQHLNIYRTHIRLVDVDKRFCIGFTDYLRSAGFLKNQGKKVGKERRILSQTTQAEMLNTLSIVLNEAVREGLIRSNATRQLSKTERIKTPKGTREYLTVEELQRMIETPVTPSAEGDKNAFLFCCFCGLRHSDVSALRWGNIINDGNKMWISIIQKKTQHPVIAPLSEKAIACLPHRGGKDNDEKVFDMPNYCITNRRLKRWAKDAQINKNVTFHVSRHTFGTMMLTAGVDIYTTSKLMGHTDIAVTQIYAKIVDKKKEEAVNLLDRLF